jgi:hypothetical protein
MQSVWHRLPPDYGAEPSLADIAETVEPLAAGVREFALESLERVESFARDYPGPALALAFLLGLLLARVFRRRRRAA